MDVAERFGDALIWGSCRMLQQLDDSGSRSPPWHKEAVPLDIEPGVSRSDLEISIVPMANNKDQHFVPQFYLRNFGVGNSIGMFNIPHRRHFPRASIPGQ